MSLLKVNELTKIFKTFKRREGLTGAVKDLFYRNYEPLIAVDHICFNVDEGEVIGFIGPNGAGKSTTIKMLTGILKSTAGEMQVLGFDPFKQRTAYTKHIGVVFGQRTQLWWDIAVIESLKLLGAVYGVPKDTFNQTLELLIDILDLKQILHTPVRKLSLGQRIRSDLAAALIHSPKILFLDEPTIGLDAVVKVKVRNFLREINKRFKTTMILTTHDLYEIEELCRRIIIIDKGNIIYDGELNSIKTLPGLARSITVDFFGEIEIDKLTSLVGEGVNVKQIESSRAELSYIRRNTPTAELMKIIVENFKIADLELHDPNIEDIVMKIYRDGIQGQYE
ncbi:MAG: ATP-binding cassette domain-containing protein [Bdellovibrionales bacterium]|nr:ATP-binding cassette domain-containing protein [Bdellovibrionales bacterium]